jgi:hypothetical protein
MKLWVDDIRHPPGDGWVWAQTVAEAIAAITACPDVFEEMSLDHDLGEETTRPIVLWLCEHEQSWPRVARVHSANPVGRSWLTGMIYQYSPYYNPNGVR